MTSIETVLGRALVGKLTTFDRMIFHGHMTSFFRKNAFAVFLWRLGVPLTGFASYVEKASGAMKARAEAAAREAGRPYVYLADARTAANGCSKESFVKEMVARDGVTGGLVCVLATLEPCWSFDVRGNRATHRREVVRRKRKCLHFYYYFLDDELGLIHVRVQSWFPFQIQVYVNGREYLSRKLDRAGIAYTRHDNTFTEIADLPRAVALAEEIGRREWPRLLDALARRVNPHLDTIREAGFGAYYWCLDQAEIATDLMFRNRGSLQRVLPDLYDHALRAFSSEDVLRFLGRKLRHSYTGEVTTDLKKRPEGMRVKHRAGRNSIKMYDKATVLRVETTINNPRDFRVLRVSDEDGPTSRRWVPMGKGVANAWRFLQVGEQANERYLEALANVQLKGEAVDELDHLCRSTVRDGRKHARFNPVTKTDCRLFAAVLAGEHAITGFRNRHVVEKLYDTPPRDERDERRRCARASRLIAKLRGHGLVAKVRASRLYRVTAKGHRVMGAAILYRRADFATNYTQVGAR